MSSATVAALVVVLTLAAVLLTSGVAKLRDARATRDAFDALRVPSLIPADASARALPWVEIALGVLLLVAPRGWLVPTAAALVLLMLAYTGLVARALGAEEPVSCSCFGGLGRHEIDRTTLGRNVLLTVLTVVVLWFALGGGSTRSAVTDLDRGGWWTLAAAVAAAAVAVLVAGGGSERTGAPTDHDELLDYERRPIPYGVLTLGDGRTSTLAELAATQARLVVLLNPSCGPCTRTAERLDAWAAELAPAVGVLAIYPDQASAEAAGEHARDLGASEPDLNVRRLFAVGAPAAVLLGADGFLAGGPVAGEDAVAGFVRDVLGEVSGSLS
jgi:thiol-disulfide isomerase/thioredoxin